MLNGVMNSFRLDQLFVICQEKGFNLYELSIHLSTDSYRVTIHY